MHFDEYGQPHISQEEKLDCHCLLEMTRSECALRNETESQCNAIEWQAARIFDCGMREQYGICALCWIPVLDIFRNRQIPSDYAEVRFGFAESSIARYAVPKTAIRSLEALYRDQRCRPISVQHYAKARYNSPGYVEWESDTYNHKICLYPWKFWDGRSELDVLTD